MFENDVAGLDEDATLAAVEGNEHTAVEVEVTRLLLAAHWADLKPGDAVDPHGLPGAERALQPGGEGTPEIADFAPAELGCSLKSSAGSARRLMADALDLRHRLPRTWAAARAGQAPTYQARQVAKATRHLTVGQARQVDQRVAAALGTVSWGRLQDLVDGLVYEADPEGADAAAELAARERFVRLGRTTEHGLKLVIARAAAGDAIWFKATLDRIAHILGLHGDTDPIDVRRSKAIGILAQPAYALQLLCDHQDDPDQDQDSEPEQGVDVLDPDPVDEPLVEANEATADPQPADKQVEEPAHGGRSRRLHQSLRIVPPPFDPERARPKTVVYVHLAEEALRAGTGVARVEDVGPVLLSRLRQVLGTRCQIQLKPVIDVNDQPAPVDSYEIPARIAEHLRLRQPADVFPYAAGGSRRTDLDHTIPYRSPDTGGPPGQTAVGNLGPLARYHHRLKTHGGWHVRQPEPGTWVWRTPHGRIFLVNSTGTHPLGKGSYAQRIWRAAKAPLTTDPSDPTEGTPLERIVRAQCETSRSCHWVRR